MLTSLMDETIRRWIFIANLGMRKPMLDEISGFQLVIILVKR